ncbi:MAG: thiamine diphosphokinase [Oscillospiraceae bacterium]|jgi:thiamine pyrophosphokinase|nr:thiamine diphosphokinase [Oscillospiraceae bacterium]
MATCFLIGAAPSAAVFHPQAGDCIIAADGGAGHVLASGHKPDLLVGDFDSFTQSVPYGVPTIRLPSEKDDTDMALALEEGKRKGFRRFELIGGSGGRLDMTLANIQLLAQAARDGLQAILRTENGESATALAGPDILTLEGEGTVSVLALSERAEGVAIRGMKYQLQNGTLTNDTPRGVSNLLQGRGEITLTKGTLLVLWETAHAAAVLLD